MRGHRKRSKSSKSRPIRSKIDSIEIERPQIVHFSNVNWAVFERFFEILTKTSEMAKKWIFWSIFASPGILSSICQNLWIFINFFHFCLCRTIVRQFLQLLQFCDFSKNIALFSRKPPDLPDFSSHVILLAKAAFRCFFEPYRLYGDRKSGKSRDFTGILAVIHANIMHNLALRKHKAKIYDFCRISAFQGLI